MVGRSRGVTLIEVIVVAAIITIGLLFLLMMVPRSREQARLLSCQKNLGQIGKALAIYDQLEHQLPTIAALAGIDGPNEKKSRGPLRIMLDALKLPDLTMLADEEIKIMAMPGQAPGEIPVPGFVCGSDPNATAGVFRAPISYRAPTGDSAAGENGLFAPGRVIKREDVEATDGLSYTAAYSERMVGDNKKGSDSLGNYRFVLGPLAGTGCPGDVGDKPLLGDAGSSWNSADYRSTLYNHALVPNHRPSCLAVDGQTAFMGASSGHVRGVNLLFLDGSVSLVTPAIDPKIWKEFARISLPRKSE
jgi:prepilin-type N-terminal cleavage/methylation domain-containing protein/prepilin-type processing-associated H-X9-DG protein